MRRWEAYEAQLRGLHIEADPDSDEARALAREFLKAR
jgi:hypothetical protein